MSVAEDTVNKLVAARTRLILEQPFLGALVLRLPLQSANSSWCATTYTDAQQLFYNSEYVESLSFDQLQFVLASEALHCGLLHFNRRGHRQAKRWQVACSYAVNLILIDEGLSPPHDALVDYRYRGLTAEEIYPLLESDDQSESHDDSTDDAQQSSAPTQAQPPRAPRSPEDATPPPHNPALNPPPNPSQQNASDVAATNQQPPSKPDANLHHSSRQPASAPPPLTQAAKNRLQQSWQQRLAGAAQQAQRAGKLGSGIMRMIELFLQPTLPWRAVLAGYMNGIARNDYSYARPSSRRGDPAIYPSLHSTQINLIVAVDVSGSIKSDELNEFMGEIDALKSQVRARVTLLTCDSKLTDDSPWIFEAWEKCQLPAQLDGGGSTDFRPPFDWIAARDEPPDLLVYFTDAEGSFPPVIPLFPVLWLIKGSAKVPFGHRIQLN